MSRIFGALFYFTKVLPSSSSPPFELLRRRVWQIRNPRDSILPVLHQWRVEGRDVKQLELQGFIKRLRGYRRYGHALQISEWMSNELNNPSHLLPISPFLKLNNLTLHC
ncbi:pentatricopeptide repeat-containing protein [Prunus yedoensis var. nudiflora]|uniref:Pentatricopeptide repeat-containing protein n=1 Tax=Prunus yedoensis var. nudiflora TaxID=2094558 RepID=A0A314YP26_PRUYE|nr:pentatricopeptide repeat-containing protein [Prunus yedoensis var. nudiflora]